MKSQILRYNKHCACAMTPTTYLGVASCLPQREFRTSVLTRCVSWSSFILSRLVTNRSNEDEGSQATEESKILHRGSAAKPTPHRGNGHRWRHANCVSYGLGA